MTALPRRLGANREAVAGLLLLGAIALAALLLPPFLPDPAAQPDILARVEPPSAAHPLGTDHLNRDLLARLMAGTRVSLAVAALSVLLSASVGAAVGLAAGYLGGAADAVLMRLVDGAMAIPRVFIALLALAAWDRVPLAGLVCVIGGTGWFATSRLVRAEVVRLRGAEFVRAAEALGGSAGRIIFRHLLPNAAGPLIVAATLAVGDVILIEAGLSFLGVGVAPPTPTLGGMIQETRHLISEAPLTSVAPGAMIFLTVLAASLVGDGLRDALDPRGLTS